MLLCDLEKLLQIERDFFYNDRMGFSLFKSTVHRLFLGGESKFWVRGGGAGTADCTRPRPSGHPRAATERPYLYTLWESHLNVGVKSRAAQKTKSAAVQIMALSQCASSSTKSCNPSSFCVDEPHHFYFALRVVGDTKILIEAGRQVSQAQWEISMLLHLRAWTSGWKSILRWCSGRSSHRSRRGFPHNTLGFLLLRNCRRPCWRLLCCLCSRFGSFAPSSGTDVFGVAKDKDVVAVLFIYLFIYFFWKKTCDWSFCAKNSLAWQRWAINASRSRMPENTCV